MKSKEIILRDAFALKWIRKFRGKVSDSNIRTIVEILASPVGELKYWFTKVRDENVKMFQYKLGIVVIIKNEALYIKEWIEFHRSLGFDKFIIYDNGSNDEIETVLNKYVKNGVVDYIYYPGKNRQCDAYNDAVYRYKDIIQYMAIIDVDEFILPSIYGEDVYRMIDNILKSNVNYGGVVINWLCFGSNGHIIKPDGLVIEEYTRRGLEEFRANQNYKTIINPRRVFAFVYPHFPFYLKKCYGVDTDKNMVKTYTKIGVYNKLRINHYFTKSKEEYEKKMNRGKADRSDYRTMDDFYMHDVNDIEDNLAKEYATNVKKYI